MVMAISVSVTVSMGELINGVLNVILRVTLDSSETYRDMMDKLEIGIPVRAQTDQRSLSTSDAGKSM